MLAFFDSYVHFFAETQIYSLNVCMKIIYQCQSKGCGYACVKMLLCKRDKNRNWAYADEPEAEQNAPSLNEIKEYGAKHGLNLRSYRVGSPYDWRFLASKNALVLLEEDGLQHMCVLVKASKSDLTILDPSKGKRKIKIRRFERIFSGVVMVTDLGVVSRKKDVPKPNIRSVKNGWIPMLLSFASVFLIGMGFLLSERVSKWIALPFYLVGLTSLGLFLVCSRYLQSVFDRKYQRGLLEEDPELRKELFTHYYTYKNAIFGTIPRVSCEIGILCSLLFYISFTSPWQGVMFGIAGVVLLIMLCFIQKRSAQIAKDVEKDKDDFLRGESDKIGLENKQKSYQKKGVRYSRLWFLKILTVLLVSLLFCLGSSLTKQNLVGSSYLENLILCLLFSIQINDLASYLPSILSNRNEASYFWYHFVRTNGK